MSDEGAAAKSGRPATPEEVEEWKRSNAEISDPGSVISKLRLEFEQSKQSAAEDIKNLLAKNKEMTEKLDRSNKLVDSHYEEKIKLQGEIRAYKEFVERLIEKI